MNYWAWGGKYIGKRVEEYLYSYKGKPIGYFSETEIYDFNGNYLCEISDENDRLIVNKSKKWKKKASRSKPSNIGATTPHVNYVEYVMTLGYEDFIIND